MLCFSSSAILLKRSDLGDYDLIVSFFSLKRGRISVIAKNAKKSRKRFSGLLEPFAKLDIVCRTSRNNGMPVLQEVSMRAPYARIRGALFETAYASYWVELIHGWIEQFKPQPEIYRLLDYGLDRLDRQGTSPHIMSIIFQTRFLSLTGFAPHLSSCAGCAMPLDNFPANTVVFDLAKGGIVCNGCSAEEGRFRMSITKGTAKLLSWIQWNGGDTAHDMDAALRLRFNNRSLAEAQRVMEAFVPYHLGRMPRSLKFIKDLRSHEE
jgi:DNA repair protein RecO (recombination protein O)